MWKKIAIMLLAMTAVISVGSAFYSKQMNANSKSTVTLVTRDTSAQGSKYIFGNFEGQEIVMEAIKDNVSGGILAMTQGEQIRLGICNIADCAIASLPYEDSTLYYVENAITGSLNTSAQSAVIRGIFIPDKNEVKDGGSFGLTATYRKDTTLTNYGTINSSFQWNGIPMTLKWTEDFCVVKQSPFVINNRGYRMVDGYTGINGKFPTYKSDICLNGDCTVNKTQYAYVIRPAMILDKSKVAFALSVDVSGDTLTELAKADSATTLKLRILDQSIPKISVENENKSFAKGDTIKVPYSNADPSKHISVLFFNASGQISYYQNFSGQPSKGELEISTENLPIGQYSLKLVNEEFTGNSQPSAVSQFSEVYQFTIVDAHKISYTKQPESGASAGKDYEYTKNVSGGQKVGYISVSPQGVMPLTYTIETNGGDNSYLNFEIDGLDSDNASSATSLNVKIKANAPDLGEGGLKAGTYKFCISAKDDNGYPETPSTSNQTKVCTTLKVEKPQLKIEFDEKGDTKKTAAEAATNWNETATVTPNNSDVKIKYSKVGGDIGLIDIDPDTGEITYKGNGAYGKVKIRAIADDKDKDNGADNYDEVYTEKEIIICQELDGAITPHANSSDASVPTFSATDVNVKSGGVIGTIKGTQGTPDNLSSGTITYTYGLKGDGDGSFFSVNATTGEIKTTANLPVGSYHITVTVIDKWSPQPKEIPVTINVGVAKAEELKFYENSSSNTVINQKTVNFTDTNVSVYATVKGSTNSNPVTYKIKDGSTNVITINPNSGVVTIKGTGTVIIVAEKKGVNGQADAQAELSFTVKPVSQAFIYTTDSTLSTERPKTGEKYNTLKEAYAPNKTFNVYTTGNPTGSTVTYKLKDGSPTDVISVDADGTIHILNASLPTQIGKVIVEATSHDPSGNYDDKTIELPIDIEKGERTVAFKENPINVVSGSGSVNPEILVDGTPDTSGTAVIEVDPNANDIAWTNDGAKIEYEWESEEAKDVKIKVTKPADRNYKAATGEGILHILGAEENVLTLSTPGKVTYGDHFTIRSTQDDSMSTNVQYTFETDNGVYISAPQVNGNKAEFDALRYSGSTEITIKVTRTADGELPLTKTVKIKVLPKPITIEIEDKEKERLEDNPELTYKDFKDKLVTWNGVRDTINESVIKLSTTAGKYSPVGTYPISAKNAQKQLNDNYPNYTFTIKEGKLNIKDNGDKNFWDTDDDGCPDLNIELTDDNGDTILINGDKNEDGIPDYNIDTNGDGKPDLNIDTDNDGKPDLNLVQLKSWKPSKCVTVNGVDYASGITAKPEINIDLDNDGIPDINIDNKGDFKPHINISKDGKTPHINIADIHEWNPNRDYKTGNFTYDSMDDKITPQLNIDTDGDGYPDLNLDLDNDGIPDLNIDTDGDFIPNLNIDGDGDGKPDINVDRDDDGVADENIKEISEWKPEHNVDGPFGYDTMNFNEEDPDDPDKEPNGEVQGSYYPGANVGGALTGDTSEVWYLFSQCLFSLALISWLIFKHSIAHRQ